jgi:hypothetical protein
VLRGALVAAHRDIHIPPQQEGAKPIPAPIPAHHHEGRALWSRTALGRARVESDDV